LKAEGKFDLLDKKSEVKPLVRHIITKELQLYYEKITEALLSSSEKLRETALESIREDQGIQQLLPYFIQFVMDQVLHHLCNDLRLA
jgi:transcription initiation factor TFIID subunit 6